MNSGHRRDRRIGTTLGVMGSAALLISGLVILGSTVSAGAASGVTAPITVTPGTGLTNGEMVTITGSGFTANSIGNILECNSDKNQPNVMDGGLVNASISVSCNAPSLQAIVTVSASGAVSTKFKVVEGTVGPPCGPAPAVVTCPATDTAGKSPTADAALYPCPPTAAQAAIGDVCTLTFGDEANDTGSANITFASSSPPPTPTTAAPTATTKPPTTATTKPPTTATTKPPTTATTVAPVTGAGGGTTTPSVAPSVAPATSPSALATTGPGPGIGWLGAIGGVLLLLGLLVLLGVLERPRRAFAVVIGRDWLHRTGKRVDRDRDASILRHVHNAASSMVGHVDVAGRRLAGHASRAPAAARGLTRQVASASMRTAAWLLGR
jgi:hypothetical protein